MKNPLISIITIVNNEKVYGEFKKSLDSQINISYELIKISNTHQEFLAARDAYNAAAKNAQGKFLVFCHPDIRFLHKYALYNITKSMSTLAEFGVVGVAGSPLELKAGNRIIISNILHGEQKSLVGQKITKPTEVQTVDECFFILSKQRWRTQPFSNENGWHLYAVEQCLLSNKNGLKNYVVPAELWHTSDGKSEDYHYYTYLRHLIKQYRSTVPLINTTVKMWPTQGIKSQLYISYWQLNRWVKKLLNIKVK